MINLKNLENLSRHNTAFIKEILEVYITNTPKDLEAMSASVEREDWPTVRYYAHKLKSSSFTIGFEEGHRLFQDIEHNIKDEVDYTQIPEQFNRAVELCDQCIHEVKVELTRFS